MKICKPSGRDLKEAIQFGCSFSKNLRSFGNSKDVFSIFLKNLGAVLSPLLLLLCGDCLISSPGWIPRCPGSINAMPGDEPGLAWDSSFITITIIIYLYE